MGPGFFPINLNNDKLDTIVLSKVRVQYNARKISFDVGMVRRLMQETKNSQTLAAKRILRYLKGIINYGVLFPNTGKLDNGGLVSYSDSDWCGGKVKKRSTMEYVLKIFQAPVSWCSGRQIVVALSSCAAEYILARNAALQEIWL